MAPSQDRLARAVARLEDRRVNPRRAVDLPEHVLASARPLRDYLDEQGCAPDEETLLALFRAERMASPPFLWRRVAFPGGAVAFASWRDETEGAAPTRVYARPDEYEMFRAYTPASFLAELAERGSMDGYEAEGQEEAFSRRFWARPPRLYHGTGRLASVLRRGLEEKAISRGSGNEDVGDAVFVTRSLDEARDYAGVDGGGVVRIDTAAMARDGVTPRAAPEPSLDAERRINAIAKRLRLAETWDAGDQGAGHPDTVILFGPVPARYLRVVP